MSGCSFDLRQPVNGTSRSVCPRQLLRMEATHLCSVGAGEHKLQSWLQVQKSENKAMLFTGDHWS